MRGKLQTAGNIDLHLCPFINICDHNLATVRQVRAAKTRTRTHARAHCLSATTLSEVISSQPLAHHAAAVALVAFPSVLQR